MKFDDNFFKEQMKALSVNFVKHMDEPIEKLQCAILDIENNKFTRENRAEIQSIAHNYKGTGTTYGFKNLTKTATELEKMMLKEPEIGNDKLLPYMHKLLDALNSAYTSVN